MKTFLITVLLAIMPISELRGAIPFGVYNGMPLVTAFFTAVIANALVGPIALLFLSFFHQIFYKWEFYARIFDRVIERARNKVKDGVEKYGMWGICLFVAIPFPLTGAWTGTLGGWILGVQKRKILPAVLIGVTISGIIVSLIVHFGVQGLDFMIKHIEVAK